MGRSGHGDQVEVFAFKEFSEVLIDLGFSFAPGIGESFGPVEIYAAGSDQFDVEPFG